MVEDEPFWHDDEHDDLLAEEEANRSRRRAFIGVVTASIIGAGALVGATTVSYTHLTLPTKA